MNNNFLYIDPGTGSMLFTVILGAATTILFLLREVYIKLRVLLSGGKYVGGRHHCAESIAHPFFV